MKLLDKIKNLFMDDVDETEDIDVEVDHESELQYKETPNVLPKVMRDTIMKEEKKEVPSRENMEKSSFQQNKKFDISELEMPKQEVKPKFDFSKDFAEDLVPNRSMNKNVLEEAEKERKKINEVKKATVELYPNKLSKEKPKFKPTPVISPVYGVLDKNYTKEEVKEKSEDNTDMKRPSKKVDFETVRKKAFGNITDEIKDNLMCENCELYKEAIKNKINEDNVLYDSLKEDDPVEEVILEETKEEITIEKAYDNYEDYGVSYETPRRSKTEEVVIQDNSNTDSTGEAIEFKEKIDDSKEVLSSDDIEYKMDFSSIKESVSSMTDEETQVQEDQAKDAKVDEDFFELIDSMYKDRSEE